MISRKLIIDNHNKEWRKKILKEYEESRSLPRKKKKAILKSLRLDWSIANWSPLNMKF